MYYSRFPPRDDIWSVMSSLLRDFVGPFLIVCGFDASFFIAFRALAYKKERRKRHENAH